MNNNRNVSTLLNYAEEFRGAVWLEDWLPFTRQRTIMMALFFILSVIAVGSWIQYQIGFLPTSGLLSEEYVAPAVLVIVGTTIIFLLALLAVHGFYLFFRLADPQKESLGDDQSAWNVLSYPAAEILLRSQNTNSLADGFIASRFGKHVFLRCGVRPEAVRQFLLKRESSSLESSVELIKEKEVDLESIAHALYEADDGFADFLFDNGVDNNQFLTAARWIQNRDKRWRYQTRVWSPDHMDNVPTIGRDFSYGKAYTLEKFSKSAKNQSVFLGASNVTEAFSESISQVFNILSRPRDGNVLLIGGVSGGVSDVVNQVRTRLERGEVPAEVGNRHMYVLDTQALITATEDKARFDRLLKKILMESTQAGNILLVIENVSQFSKQASKIGADVFGILDTFLRHPDLPIIATATQAEYHRSLEGTGVMSHFGAVPVHDVESGVLMRLLQEVAESNEGKTICTVSGLQAVARGGRELITDDEMPEAAVNLLLEILTQKKTGFVDKEYVDTYLSEKTGVPTGAVQKEERSKLTNLADQMSERIVGQKAAIEAVSQALKRNRSGVESQDRPIGTFLFLGPTGVGKTETAKTLARSYFDGESSMQRLDMSEYSQPQSVDTLRGRSGKSGRLANMMRENPYSVLLLDEFEKAHSRVHDLFLQILDEGHFTDGRGRRVNLENSIIIATSNAGSDKIFSLVESGEELKNKKDEIIRGLIDSGIFRPELLNRFDATVLYHPLSRTQLEKVTRLLLGELRGRIKRRGYKLKIDDNIPSYLVEQGYDPKFGARAIQRVIQNTVENAIAEKIINAGLQAGDTITLSVSDLHSASESSSST